MTVGDGWGTEARAVRGRVRGGCGMRGELRLGGGMFNDKSVQCQVQLIQELHEKRSLAYNV